MRISQESGIAKIIIEANARGSYYFTEPCINTTAYENTIHGILGKLIDREYEKRKKKVKEVFEKSVEYYYNTFNNFFAEFSHVYS